MARVGAPAALDETGLLPDLHRPVETGAVKPPLIDVAQEVAGADRRPLGLHRDDDVARAGMEEDPDRGGPERRRGRGGGLGEGRRAQPEQEESDEMSRLHGRLLDPLPAIPPAANRIAPTRSAASPAKKAMSWRLARSESTPSASEGS